MKNNYDHVFTVEPASNARATIDWLHRILKEERDIVISSRALEATASGVEIHGVRHDALPNAMQQRATERSLRARWVFRSRAVGGRSHLVNHPTGPRSGP